MMSSVSKLSRCRTSGSTHVVPQRIDSNKQIPKSTTTLTNSKSFDVEDIGGSCLPTLLIQLMKDQLLTPDGEGVRHLPALFFSDDTGLKMWSKITHLPNYYQTRDEIELLETWGNDVIDRLDLTKGRHNGLIAIDLGAGDVRKVLPLLHQFDTLDIPITYYALDLSSASLATAMSILSSQEFNNITCQGLWGSFDSAINFIRKLPANIPRVFMSLGSMFGNDFPEPAIALLNTWCRELRPYDRWLVGMDGTIDHKVIWDSYHDDSGLFEKFIRNGMKVSNKVLDTNWFKDEDWDVEGVMVSEPWVMHKFVFTARRAVVLPTKEETIMLEAGAKIEGYRAFKLDAWEMKRRFAAAGLEECCSGWRSETKRINSFLLKRNIDAEKQVKS